MAMIRIKRGTSANLPASAPAGELMYTTDEKYLYVGTGGGVDALKVDIQNVDNLMSDGKIRDSILPRLAITETFVANSEADMLALDVQEGDIALRADISKTFIANGGDSAEMSGWSEIRVPDNFDAAFAQKTTDELAEGSNRLYFTQTRARQSVSAAGDLSYDAGTGEFSVQTYKSADFDTDFGNKSTDDLAEGEASLYFTDERAQASAETKIDALKGVAGGLASLDSAGKIPEAQLPDSVLVPEADANQMTFGGNDGEFAQSDGAGNLQFTDTIDGGAFETASA